MSENAKRFSDEKLFKLCQDFDTHIKRFNEYEIREQGKFIEMIEAQRVNTVAITELTKSVTRLTNDTLGVVKTYNDLRGAARVGDNVQKFMLWLLKWGFIGAGIVAAIRWGLKYST
jgi:hypothetical protein